MVTVGMFPIFVSDQQRALEFYRDKLNFKVIMDNPYPGSGPERFRWITVAPDPMGPQIILYHPGMNAKKEKELKARIGTWTGIIFHTDDIHDSYANFKRRGVKFEAPPSQQFWGGWETSFSDPDGNRFHLGTPE